MGIMKAHTLKREGRSWPAEWNKMESHPRTQHGHHHSWTASAPAPDLLSSLTALQVASFPFPARLG